MDRYAPDSVPDLFRIRAGSMRRGIGSMRRGRGCNPLNNHIKADRGRL